MTDTERSELRIPTAGEYAWRVTPELLKGVGRTPLTIRTSGRELKFVYKPGEYDKRRYEIEVRDGASCVALLEDYGGWQLGVLLPTRRHRAAVIVRSLDEVVQLLKPTLRRAS